MDLRDIEYFTVVAEHRHVGRAAEALGLSQPALSKSLRRLEQLVGAKLVRRHPKGVELTKEGLALLDRAGELRLSLENVKREIAEVSQGRTAVFRVGIGVAVSQNYLSIAFGTFLKSEPRVTLNIVVTDNDVLMPDLRKGGLDIVVNFSGFPPTEGLTSEKLYDEEHGVWVSTTHRLARKKDVTIEDLHRERWAMAEPGVISHQRLRDMFRDKGLSAPLVAMVSRSISARLRAVASSDLLTLTTRSQAEEMVLASGVKMLNIAGLKRLRPVAAIRRDEKYMPPTLQRFISILKETAVEMKLSNGRHS